MSVDQGDGAERERSTWESEVYSEEFEFDPALFLRNIDKAREQGSDAAKAEHDGDADQVRVAFTPQSLASHAPSPYCP